MDHILISNIDFESTKHAMQCFTSISIDKSFPEQTTQPGARLLQQSPERLAYL